MKNIILLVFAVMIVFSGCDSKSTFTINYPELNMQLNIQRFKSLSVAYWESQGEWYASLTADVEGLGEQHYSNLGQGFKTPYSAIVDVYFKYETVRNAMECLENQLNKGGKQ